MYIFFLLLVVTLIRPSVNLIFNLKFDVTTCHMIIEIQTCKKYK